LGQHLTLFQVYHNFVLPHAHLRQPVPLVEATNGTKFGEEVAAAYTGDGGRSDRSRVELARSAPLSGAAVATAADGVINGAG